MAVSKRGKAVAWGLAIALLGAWAYAQMAPMGPRMPGANQRPTGPRPIGTLHMKCGIGSFRIMGDSVYDIPAMGKVDMTFQGTVLIHNLKGKPVVLEGKVKQEFDDHLGRVVFFGRGRMIIEGEYRTIQWFGRDLDCIWTGNGAVRITGEFDSNGNTGTFWYSNPKDYHYWQTSAMTLTLPERVTGASEQPRERPGGPPPGNQ